MRISDWSSDVCSSDLLYDTPGMEDGIALLDYLDVLAPPSERLDGPERIRRFLQSPESKRRFEQEARVLQKLLDCDAGLYVVDVRDPILGKHKDRSEERPGGKEGISKCRSGGEG